MPIKLKKTNIQYDLETPEKGWIILGVDEDGNLVKKDETGVYEKIVKDETYGIFLRLETDYLTIGNRIPNSTEGLYSLSQGDYNKATNIFSTAIGKYAYSNSDFSYSRGENITANGKYSIVSGFSSKKENLLYSNGINSFVHSAATITTNNYGSNSDYSVILGGQNNKIGTGSINSSIIGGSGNFIQDNKLNTVILGCTNIIETESDTVYTTNINNRNNIISDIGNFRVINNTTMISHYIESTDVMKSLTLYTETLSGTTALIKTTVTANGYYVRNSSTGIIMSNGTVDTSQYLKLTGGTLSGDIVLSKTSSTIKTLSSASSTNIIVGINTFLNVSTNNQLSNNTIIGSNSIKNLSGYATNNIILGSDNANIAGSGTTNNINTISNSIIIGTGNRPRFNNTQNEIIIGHNCIGKGDNTVVLGDDSIVSTYLRGNIYQNGFVIQTSDARLKTSVRKLTNDEINAAKDLSKEIGLYRFLLDVKKGKEEEHFGLTVQKVMEIMVKNNLNPLKYEFIRIDMNTEPAYQKYLKDGTLYGLNYQEMILFIIAGIEQRLIELENK